MQRNKLHCFVRIPKEKNSLETSLQFTDTTSYFNEKIFFDIVGLLEPRKMVFAIFNLTEQLEICVDICSVTNFSRKYIYILVEKYIYYFDKYMSYF